MNDWIIAGMIQKVARDIIVVAVVIVFLLAILGGGGFILFHFVTKYW
jgi:hypothetical protein